MTRMPLQRFSQSASPVILLVAVLCGPVRAQQQPGQLAANQPSVPPAKQPYAFITGSERFQWFVVSTVGPASLFGAGPLSAGWGTMLNKPEEYGPGWEGFGKRYGMRLTGISTSNAIEALTGAALREDPRYIPAPPGTSFGKRAGRIVGHAFLSHRPDGSVRFSYSRVAGNVGNNFLSNLWRVESESTTKAAAVRCIWGLTGRMGANAFAEFWPSVYRKWKRK